MRLKTTYRQILSISAPIMLGSAAQNVIALSDSVFLYYLSEEDFASIGFVGVFYLIVAAIGYGFSRGGQIMIARRMGEQKPEAIGRTFQAMLAFELTLALVMFLFMQYGTASFFALFVKSEVILEKSLSYLEYRSWGVFFSYLGVVFIALYTGIARTWFIILDTLVLAAVNIVLDYGLIFGHWGLPSMGIAGAGLASTTGEIVAFILFLGYVLLDRKVKPFKLFKLAKIELALIFQQYKIAIPIVAQAFVGLGSWFVFFGIVENLGERELAITNLVRMVYLILSIPCWGLSSGVNTMVSHFIGLKKRMAVIPIIWKTARISLFLTMVLAIPLVLFPQQMLYPLLGNQDPLLVSDAQPVFYVLVVILAFFSVGGVFFNGLVGTGATFYGLKMQTWCAIGYVLYIYVVVNHTNGGLTWAWAAEAFYWVAMLLFTLIYLRSEKWYEVKV